MSPLDEMSAMDPGSCFSRFLELCETPDSTQEQVLLDIVARAANTEFGRSRGFAGIHSVDAYRERVPVCDWSAFEPYSDRMQRGESDLLFHGAPKLFLLSSGTTGKEKYIPESAEGLLAKDLTSALRRVLLFKCSPDVSNLRFLPFANQAVLWSTPAGIPACTASGMTLMGTPPAIRERMAFPPDVLRCENADTLDYLVIRFALGHDVNLVVGNNPVRMAQFFAMADAHRDALVADIAAGRICGGLALDPALRGRLEALCGAPDPARAQALADAVTARGLLAPRDYWPGLRVVSCWLSGSVGGHVGALRPWVGDGVQMVDCGYGASEGKFNVPLQPGRPEGPLSLFGYFFEFIPIGGGAPRLAHELEDGAQYQMLISSYSGLYRYDIHDIVRVNGFVGKTPCICFESKTRDFANVNGEKVSGMRIMELLRDMTRAAGITLAHAAVVADDAERRYDFAVECAPHEALDAAFLRKVEEALCERELAYRIFRAQKLIAAPRILVMKSGWQGALLVHHAKSGVAANQVKLPTVYQAQPCPGMIDRIVALD